MIRFAPNFLFVLFSGGCSMDLRDGKTDSGDTEINWDSGNVDSGMEESDTAGLEPASEPDDSVEPSSEPGIEIEPSTEPDGPLHPHDQDDDGDGFTENQGDCNDNDPVAYPGAAFAESETACRSDFDADGYGDMYPMELIEPGGDCDDTNSTIHPGAIEVPGDEVDSDCDDTELCFPDFDGDGFGADLAVPSWDVSCGGVGEATQGGDCDDADPLAYPGSLYEAPYDGIDHNCDGLSDFDQDGDGYDSVDWGGTDCNDTDASSIPVDADGDGVAVCAGDCDDNNSAVNPHHLEIMLDGLDNDCDGQVDTLDVDDYVGVLFGAAGDYLSYPSGISVGDFTRDGRQDLAVGGVFQVEMRVWFTYSTV